MFPYPPTSIGHNEGTAFTQNSMALAPMQNQALTYYSGALQEPPLTRPQKRSYQPMMIASISAGFEKGDFLVREEKGSNVYFDFFEEAFNFCCQKGYVQMPKHEEKEYMDIIKRANRSVPGGLKFNTGKLLMVLKKCLVPKIADDEDTYCSVVNNGINKSKERKCGRNKNKLDQSSNTLPTDSDSSYSTSSPVHSSAYSSASTSYVDSWE